MSPTCPPHVRSQEPSVSQLPLFPQDGSAQVRTSDSELALCPASPLPCQVGLHYTHFADKEVGDQTDQQVAQGHREVYLAQPDLLPKFLLLMAVIVWAAIYNKAL